MMTRFGSLAGVMCLSLMLTPTLGLPAVAAAAPTTASDMDARMVAAMDLLDAMGGRQSIMSQISAVVPAQMQELQTQFPNMSSEMRMAIEHSMRDEMAKGVNQLLTRMAGAWAHRFTSKELREIAAFHRSPAGKKLRSEQEDLHREVSEIGRSWGKEIGKRIQQRLREQTTRPPALTS
jgi:uncharacterized protein